MTAVTEIPPLLVEKLGGAMHWRQVQQILAPPTLHASARELFRDACAMKRAGLPAAEQAIVLKARFSGYYRPLEDREIENAIRNASGTPSEVQRRWPRPAPSNIEEITSKTPGALELMRQCSPTKNPSALSTRAVIDRLFLPDDLLCFGSAGHRAITEVRSYFVGNEQSYPLIVPNAMTARYGRTKDGRVSHRTLSNVGSRLHAVVEFDHGSLDEQAAILLHLRDLGTPLRMVVFSGSKSLHGWFDVRQVENSAVEKLLRYAAFLGADTATFTLNQFVRTPNAWRDGERKQSVEFLA